MPARGRGSPSSGINIGGGMIGAMTRMLREPDPRLLWNFTRNMGWKGMRAIQRFERTRKREGHAFPPFWFISVTNRCNLRCQGCWATGAETPTDMDVVTLRGVVSEARAQGCSFFGLLGGEPLLHQGLMDVLGEFPDCYFQLFTNGTLLDDAVAGELRRLGNVSPLISIEGDAEVSDARRRGTDVLDRAWNAMAACRKARLIYGTATSVCATNLEPLVSESFVDDLVRRGALYVWYYIYRPVGPDPCPELALDPAQIRRVRQFLLQMRRRKPIVVIDAYWDHLGRAVCPAAMGIGHHVNPAGHLEPCPPVQFACEQYTGEVPLATLHAGSAFMDDFRKTASAHTRGCVLMDAPDALLELVERHGAQDSSGRGSARAELAAMTPRPSHHQPGREIPESSLAYRFAKKHWFFGFGAYG